MIGRLQLLLMVVVLSLATVNLAYARSASFEPPGTNSDNGSKTQRDAITAEPAVSDVGETLLSVTKRVTLFFNNNLAATIEINEIKVGADGNVRTEVTGDDCMKIGKLLSGNRCSLTLEITPTSGGPWTAEVVMTHSGQGRITRAEITGNTLGQTGQGEAAPSLSLSASGEQTIDFGALDIGQDATRTILLVNDSGAPLQVESIELVGSPRGISIIGEASCKVEQEVQSNGSCPVTLLWKPQGRVTISSDLIIRHTGPVGFLIVPVRGTTQGGEDKSDSDSSQQSASAARPVQENNPVTGEPLASAPLTRSDTQLPAPPSTVKVDGVSPVSSDEIFGDVQPLSINFRLIGLTGRTAIIKDSDDRTQMVSIGELASIDGDDYRIIEVRPDHIVVEVGGRRAEVYLSTALTGGGGSKRKNPASGE